MKNPRTALMMVLVCCSFATPSLAETKSYDPYEKYNRFMFKINEKADTYVMQPVARTYRKITPQPVRTVANNFFNNLRDVVSFGSNVLRGNVEKAGTDFMRVAVNTTFGLGGLINIADATGMPSNKNSLGDTFASWGWKNSHYFVYPLFGPSTVRDSVGSTITSVYSPNLLIYNEPVRYGVTALNAVETRANLLDVTDSLEEDKTVDKYAYMRDFYMSLRNKQVGNVVEEEEFEFTDEEPTNSTETPTNHDKIGENPSHSSHSSLESELESDGVQETQDVHQEVDLKLHQHQEGKTKTNQTKPQSDGKFKTDLLFSQPAQ